MLCCAGVREKSRAVDFDAECSNVPATMRMLVRTVATAYRAKSATQAYSRALPLGRACSHKAGGYSDSPSAQSTAHVRSDRALRHRQIGSVGPGADRCGRARAAPMLPRLCASAPVRSGSALSVKRSIPFRRRFRHGSTRRRRRSGLSSGRTGSMEARGCNSQHRHCNTQQCHFAAHVQRAIHMPSPSWIVVCVLNGWAEIPSVVYNGW